MATRSVALIVGGLSKKAVSGRIARALVSVKPESLDIRRVEIGELPFYNQDLETENPPAPWTAFRDTIRACDAVLFVTPEYNRGPPGALKNAIDVGSRPMGKAVWIGKPCGIVSTSPGAIGGFGANHVLRANVSYFAMPLLMQPEMYVGGADKLADEPGNITDDKAREFFTKYMQAFAAWIERNLK